MKYITLLLINLIYLPLFAQEMYDKKLDLVYERGELFTRSIKEGKIESLRNANPSTGTWTYVKLQEYKKNLGSKDLIHGSVIMPNAEGTLYSYNHFAYDTKKETYCYVAIVSYDISGDHVELKNSYMFTEKEPLNMW